MDYKSNAKAAKTQGTILCAFAAFAFKKDLVGTLPRGGPGWGPGPLEGSYILFFITFTLPSE